MIQQTNSKHKNMLRKNWKNILFLILSTTILFSCKEEAPEVPSPKKVSTQMLIDSGKALEISEAPQKLEEEEVNAKSYGPNLFMINFSDPRSLKLLPNWESTFITYPGYTAYPYKGVAMPFWFSQGPGNGYFSFEDAHYHLLYDDYCLAYVGNDWVLGKQDGNDCYPTDQSQLDLYQVAMFGDEWLRVKAATFVSSDIFFSMNTIKVRGSVPITLWFLDQTGNWRFYPKIDPGYWKLNGAERITEFQVRAASGSPADKYSIDNILVEVEPF